MRAPVAQVLGRWDLPTWAATHAKSGVSRNISKPAVEVLHNGLLHLLPTSPLQDVAGQVGLLRLADGRIYVGRP